MRAAGYRDLPFGRLYEGHVNALQLIARCGTSEQRLAAERDVELGRLFGVWNTEPADGVRVASDGPAGLRLAGRKTFCSGAGRVGGALITAKTEAGGVQLVVVDMHRERPPIDTSFWQPFGMQTSDSYAVDFAGVHVRPDETIGEPDAYMRAPWFGAGAARFVAVQTGGVERIVAEYASWLREGGRADELAVARLGACTVAARTAHGWTETCAGAWARYDRGALDSAELHVTVDAARVAVERAALDVAEAVERGVGARGLLEPALFSRLLRDLRMYLRQPAPDQALMRVGRAALSSQATR